MKEFLLDEGHRGNRRDKAASDDGLFKGQAESFCRIFLDFISRPYSPLRSLRRKTPWPSVRLRFRARFLPAGTPFENQFTDDDSVTNLYIHSPTYHIFPYPISL